MALLALTLALLSIPVATVATRVVPLDMSPLSFDDQYRGCVPAMRVALPALNSSEFQDHSVFAQIWPLAVSSWQSRGSPVSPLSWAQAIAILTFTNADLTQEFNSQVKVAGCSPQQYRDYFHFKTLHFLLTDALATLRDNQKGHKCHLVYHGVQFVHFEANVGDVVRFGHFVAAALGKSVTEGFGDSTVFQVRTCHGGDIKEFSESPSQKEVLIPPFEKFKVTNVIKIGEKVEIHLDSVGTFSKYNCEWVTGGSVLRAPLHLGGLVLATTALAVATGIL